MIGRFKLLFISVVLSFLSFVDRLERFFLRVTFILLIVFSILFGFNRKFVQDSISSLPLIFSESPEVLGTKSIEYPLFISGGDFPNVTARSVFVVELNKDKILVDINGDKELAPASTTKLMTALVSLDLYNVFDYLLVPKFCTEVPGQKSGLKPNEVYSVRNLIEFLLINSSADAACVLSTGKVSYSNFIELMNSKAESFAMFDTHFTNPIGLDDVNGDHISTAYDLYKLTGKALNNYLVETFVKTKVADIQNSEGRVTHIWNTNDLLWKIPGTVGVKTGKTEDAGEVLIYRYNKGVKDILIIVMGSENRFEDTANILKWVLSSYSWGI